MSRKSLILSSAGLKNIVPNINNNGDEFVFIFGDKEVRMSKISADFISPLISRLHRTDPTIKTYKYPRDDKMNEIFNEKNLEQIRQISEGNEIYINEKENEKEKNELQELSILLWNEELFNKIEEIYSTNTKETKIDETLKYLSKPYLRKHGNINMILSKTYLDDISNSFYELDQNLLKNLPCDILLSIVKNKQLKLEDEDSLLEFIESVKRVHENEPTFNYNEFLEEIELSFLSKDKLRSILSNINMDNITNRLLDKIKIIILEEETERATLKSTRYIKIDQRIEYNGTESCAFKGIISHLTEKCGGNVHDNNKVNVTSSSVYGGRIAKNTVDLEDRQHYFQSESKENSWLKYDFKERKVHPTHYSIRTRHDHGKGGCHPQNWVIEGSNTDRDDDWKKLDSRSNITVLDDANRIHTFNIQEKLSDDEFFRYLRIRQTGKETWNHYYLTLSALEYFGRII